MDDDNRLLELHLIYLFFLVLNLMELLHTLQEQCCVQTEREHFLQIGDVMVQEWELARAEGVDRLRRVRVPRLDAQVIDFDHVTVVLL